MSVQLPAPMAPGVLADIIAKHDRWLCGEEGGARADLSGADLSGATLRDADLRGADLSDGVTFRQYLDEVVPALLTAGGKPLAEVATPEAWACHDWTNCPMATAFGVHTLEDVPPLYRAHARQFVQLFDAWLSPLPGLRCRFMNARRTWPRSMPASRGGTRRIPKR